VRQKTRTTFVLTHPTEIIEALVGLKDVAVVAYERRGPDVELMIEQVVDDVRCPTCTKWAQVKERPVVHDVDLPVYGTPMSLAWKKHRMRCVNPRCAKRSWVREDHRIAAKHFAHHQGSQVGHAPGRRGPHRLGSRRRAGH
jgi:transposase